LANPEKSNASGPPHLERPRQGASWVSDQLAFTTGLTDATIHTAVAIWCTDRIKALELYGDIKGWDTSRVTNMRKLFRGRRHFNDDISGWNVGNVTDMCSMFWCARLFNQPLNKWDVKNVRDFSLMFYGATSFNQPLDSWHTASVEDMHWMFSEAVLFNQSLESWSCASLQDADEMFEGAALFYQPNTVKHLQPPVKDHESEIAPADPAPAPPRASVVRGPRASVVSPSAEHEHSSAVAGKRLYWRTMHSAKHAAKLLGARAAVKRAAATSATQPSADAPPEQQVDVAAAAATAAPASEPGTEPAVDTPTPSRRRVSSVYFPEESAPEESSPPPSRRRVSSVHYPAAPACVSAAAIAAAPSPPAAAQPAKGFAFSDDTIYDAVETWCERRAEALTMYGPISSWDLSGVSDISGLFADREDFNDDISSWDVSGVTAMVGTFCGAKSFNQPLNTWDVSEVRCAKASPAVQPRCVLNPPVALRVIGIP
jgi:surface protein